MFFFFLTPPSSPPLLPFFFFRSLSLSLSLPLPFLRAQGTTVVANAVAGTDYDATHGTTTFVGGASDGVRGSAVLDVATAGEGLLMRRSVFFFQDVYTVLGGNITSSAQAHAGAPVWHTVAQRRLSGSGVFTSTSGGAPLPGGFNASLPAGTAWVWEGGVGVLLLPPPPPPLHGAPRAPPVLLLSTAVREGDWKNIGAESGPVALALFVLTLEFGAPVAGADFAYAVFPNLSLAAFEAAAGRALSGGGGGLTVVRNDAGAQAVLHGAEGALQASVFALDEGGQGGIASLDAGVAGWHAAVDAPGAFIVRAAQGVLAFTAASPTQGGAWAARLRIDRAVPPAANATCGAAPWAVVFAEPPGDGSSQTAACAMAVA
jgi:hypothetical protein